MIYQLYAKLKQKGVLSINQRNADYVLKYNSRKLYPVVDNKLKTKQLAAKASIAVPQLYQVIENEHQVAEIDKLLAPYQDFVIKPAHGAGGDGIMVISGRVKDRYRKVNGQLLTTDDLKYHLSCSLSGAYSLAGHPDQVLIEHRVVVDEVFSQISYQGVPDIRIIVFLGYPVMAMVRLPTQQSDGKANLHQGAIGVGVDLSSGQTLDGVHKNDVTDVHPDTLNEIAGVQVPYWQEMLQMAAKAYDLTGLGYLGVDIVLDKEQGPLMLELNARPGLNIQIANRQGIDGRLQTIKARASQASDDVDERIAFSQQHFEASRA